jgi:hypothetical protein
MKLRFSVTLTAGILLALATTSCTKDRTCTCTYSNSKSGSTTTDYTVTIKDATKGQAKANCVSTVEVDNGTTFTTDCKLS